MSEGPGLSAKAPQLKLIDVDTFPDCVIPIARGAFAQNAAPNFMATIRKINAVSMPACVGAMLAGQCRAICSGAIP
jgi:hypothetical protein